MVSVIIPTYNRAHLVGRAISSVLAQTFQDFEVIVADDASTDNILHIVDSFNDPRIQCIRRLRNGGVSAARNTGLVAAQGRYIAFLDSDDEYLPTKLEQQLQIFSLEDPADIGAVECGRTVIEGDRQTHFPPSQRGRTIDDLLSVPLGVAIGQFCIKRQLLDNGLLFDESLCSWEDWDFLVRLWQKPCVIGFVDDPLYVVHQHQWPRLSAPDIQMKGRLRLLQKYSREFEARPQVRGEHHFRIALTYYSLRQIQSVRLHLLSALKARPANLKWYLLLLGALCGRRAFGLTYRLYKRFALFRASQAAYPAAE